MTKERTAINPWKRGTVVWPLPDTKWRETVIPSLCSVSAHTNIQTRFNACFSHSQRSGLSSNMKQPVSNKTTMIQWRKDTPKGDYRPAANHTSAGNFQEPIYETSWLCRSVSIFHSFLTPAALVSFHSSCSHKWRCTSAEHNTLLLLLQEASRTEELPSKIATRHKSAASFCVAEAAFHFFP